MSTYVTLQFETNSLPADCDPEEYFKRYGLPPLVAVGGIKFGLSDRPMGVRNALWAAFQAIFQRGQDPALSQPASASGNIIVSIDTPETLELAKQIDELRRKKRRATNKPKRRDTKRLH